VLIDPSAYRTETERRVATFVNPVPRKGVEIALALAAYRPDIPFEFVESWHLRRRVFALVQSRAAHHGNIRLLRHTDDMRTVYCRSRVVLAPSLWEEAWGRIVSEAQVSGIPAIVSDSGGLPEAVGDGGIVVGRHAPIADWLSALSRLWDNSAEYERYVKRALAHAARPEFQPQQVVRTLLQLVEQHRGSRTP
jgi:glycosyltransferase involved in cell wall biosynthesis